MHVSLSGCLAQGHQAKVHGWQDYRQESDRLDPVPGNLVLRGRQLYKSEPDKTISGPQPERRASCTDKDGQPIHQTGDRELDPRSPV